MKTEPLTGHKGLCLARPYCSEQRAGPASRGRATRSTPDFTGVYLPAARACGGNRIDRGCAREPGAAVCESGIRSGFSLLCATAESGGRAAAELAGGAASASRRSFPGSEEDRGSCVAVAGRRRADAIDQWTQHGRKDGGSQRPWECSP